VDDSTYNLFVMKELMAQIDSTMEVEQALHGKEALEKVL
jgi:hypothetical protein